MPVYTVHAPKPCTATDQFVFVRDGFHFWAFVAGPFWLLANRLWLALVAYLVLSFAGEVALSRLGTSLELRGVIMFLVALLMGFEGASLKRWSLSRGKWQELDVVVAKNREAAEHRFFERWALRSDTSSAGYTASLHAYRSPAHDVIGLFPQPGVMR